MFVRARITLNGIVQGVGFRPFVHRLAESFHLSGWVANTSQGVIIEVEGDRDRVNGFYQQVLASPPPMATIMRQTIEFFPAIGSTAFEIREGIVYSNEFTPVSPDMAMCNDCYQELIDPDNRRYGYPFINCTNCGPRFTIIQTTPYDRKNTTMRDFKMCPECEAEYNDITNRRYHAEPNACPVCGPEVWLWRDGIREVAPLAIKYEDPIKKAIELLKAGCIVAVKGIGGFHLACNALDSDAIKRLREKKRREKEKPFAIMSRNIEGIQQYCEVDEQERDLLLSTASPIVLLKKRLPCLIPDGVAPNNKYLGVMLPYTPLHYLLMNDEKIPALVMTSGNISDEPLIKDNDEAMDRLSGVADYILMHNREIYNRCDDSVVQVVDCKKMVIRRSRGYAPYPLWFDIKMWQILAVGAELKATFCLTSGNFAFLSQHLGDLKGLEVFEFFKEAVEQYRRLFRIEPEIIAYDLHPDYLSTKFALQLSTLNPQLSTFPIQHHHAHIVSCMAENGVDEKVLGVALDGIGYGTDGHIWGGEFLLTDYSGFERIAHLKYIPMPGADMATKQPWRMAVSYLYAACGCDIPSEFIERWGKERVKIIIKMMEQGLNSPLTSSAGRLFDAVASIIGIRDEIDYEAQAAIEIEMMAEEHCDEGYGFFVDRANEPWVIDTIPMIRDILKDVRSGAGVVSSIISAKFHNTIIAMIHQISRLVREKWMINKVALSGGVFQNRYLLERVKPLLERNGFVVFSHSKVPANDGGISLGQAVIASRRIKNVSGYTCKNNEDFRLSGSR
ncbi:MAG: carbamoyltransferase HypF [Candidatus Desantisbacteria bacterium]